MDDPVALRLKEPEAKNRATASARNWGHPMTLFVLWRLVAVALVRKPASCWVAGWLEPVTLIHA